MVERFAKGVTLMQDPCLGLVSLIEKGNLDGKETRDLLEKVIHPMLEKGIDTIVLGCTHYPLVIPLVKEIAGPNVNVIDPAPAVARQVQRVLREHNWLSEGNHVSDFRLMTSGDPKLVEELLPKLLGYSHPVEHIQWQDGSLKTQSGGK